MRLDDDVWARVFAHDRRHSIRRTGDRRERAREHEDAGPAQARIETCERGDDVIGTVAV